MSTTSANAPGASSQAAPLIHETKPAEDKDAGLLAKGKRKILGLGKKQDGTQGDAAEEQAAATQPAMSPTSAPSLLPSPPLTDHRASPRGSPRMRPVGIGASPNRRSMVRSASPGLHSPASSAIFERNVQEPEDSSAIPAHIKTEDHVPPVLDASSLAITDDHLNVDEVEILTHPAHQPASSAVAGGLAESVYSQSLVPEEAMASSSHADLSEHTSNYGSVDTSDPRRLSFISFADVVQAEHVEQDREMLGSNEALQYQSLASTANRSPSPVRSPASSRGMSTSPPTSGATSPRFGDAVRPAGGPYGGTSSPPLVSAEPPLQVETMRQALRKTHSGDLSGHKSQPLSPVEDSHAELPPAKQ